MRLSYNIHLAHGDIKIWPLKGIEPGTSRSGVFYLPEEIQSITFMLGKQCLASFVSTALLLTSCNHAPKMLFARVKKWFVPKIAKIAENRIPMWYTYAKNRDLNGYFNNCINAIYFHNFGILREIPINCSFSQKITL